MFLPGLISAQALTPVWLELGPDDALLARVVVEMNSSCPELRADAHPLPMHVREPIPEGLKPLCQAVVPPATRSLRWGRHALKLPRTPRRVVVIGDTGCRVKAGQLQACEDPALWPFAAVSAQVAERRPDLVIHVGDYLYREGPCPAFARGCGGPHGDTWDAWNADFFAPARKALPVAPWIFARGNHENCLRSYRGWFYYLDPRPFSETCSEYTAPYVARSGTLRLGVVDSASTQDVPTTQPAQIPIYAQQLRTLSGRADWIVDHHPFWGYTSNNFKLAPTQLTLGPAWEQARPEGIRLVLSGHVHLFEFLAFESGRPDQIIAGDSGTELDSGLTLDRSGNSVVGVRVKAGEVNMSFGLTELDRESSGWTLTLRTATGLSRLSCNIPDSGTAACAGRP